MTFMYFDETIREQGGFIIGALVLSRSDLSSTVLEQWRGLGLEPAASEYKSSDPKADCAVGQRQREIVRDLLFDSKLALTVLPKSHRCKLGEYCVDLITQLKDTGFLRSGEHNLFLDQNIKLSVERRNQLSGFGITSYPNSDSRVIAGIQVADHAAHALGGMLLEEMGLM